MLIRHLSNHLSGLTLEPRDFSLTDTLKETDMTLTDQIKVSICSIHKEMESVFRNGVVKPAAGISEWL